MSTSHDTPAPALRGRLPALLLAGSSFRIRLLSRVAGFGFFAIILAIWFLSWQQFVRGSGKVIAFHPLERRVNGVALSPHPIATVGALIRDDAGRLLMIRTQKWSGLWGIAGGNAA